MGKRMKKTKRKKPGQVPVDRPPAFSLLKLLHDIVYPIPDIVYLIPEFVSACGPRTAGPIYLSPRRRRSSTGICGRRSVS